jgi:hypothetical protein
VAEARREAAAAAARVAQAETAAEGARQLAERAVEEERAAAERRVSEAEGAVHGLQCQLQELEDELEHTRDAVKVASLLGACLRFLLAGCRDAEGERERERERRWSDFWGPPLRFWAWDVVDEVRRITSVQPEEADATEHQHTD